MAVSAVQTETVDTRRYRFAGVVVDGQATRLVVDGRPCACSQRALQLLLCLCESPQRTLNRAELLDLLWPGGQIVADEALTQAVFRARAVLGRYAGLIVTVRGVGFRLDCAVERLGNDDAAFADPPMPADPVASDTSAPTPANADVAEAAVTASPRRSPRPWILAAALLILTAIAWWRSGGWLGAPAVIDEGYALLADDARVGGDEGRRLLVDAFRREGEGDRARARALLETVHASDSDTPVPALFLALWAIGGGDNTLGDHWLGEAHARLDARGTPYLNALLAYVESERHDDSQEVLRRAGALLDLRPGAWQMRIARAHLMLFDGYRDAAAAELAQVDYSGLGHRKLIMTLADRASLGDVDGASAELLRIAPAQRETPPIQYLRGRIAWSQGDLATASTAFADCSESARRVARFDLVTNCLANVGAIAVIEQRYEDAVDILEQARIGMVESDRRLPEIDTSLMLAQLHAFAGRSDAVARELDRAESLLERFRVESMRIWVRLYRSRLLPDPTAGATDAGLPAAARDVLAARASWRDGDANAARAAVAHALREIDRDADWRDELRLLQAEIEPASDDGATAAVIDPPYPPLSRLTSRAALIHSRALLTRTGAAP